MKKMYLILLLTAISFGCTETDESFKNDNKISFITLSKVPLVEGKLNGKKAFFIVDSGASVSVLDETQKDEFGFTVILDDDGNAAGYGGNANFKRAYDVELYLGEMKFTTEFKSQNLTNIVEAIRSDGGYKISGIIGSDIMKNYNFVINYSDNSLSLGQ